MAIESPHLRDGDRYERTMHGWVDVPDEQHFRITVRLADPVGSIELTALTTPSPEYGIREARGRVLVADMRPGINPGLGEVMAALAGTTMTAGFTRRVAEVAGGREGAGYFVDAAIEIARLARQVTRMPQAQIDRCLAEGPVGAWRLDMQGWADLPASCYTYRPESERLFEERPVFTPIPPDVYGPPAGATGVFNRTKTARLERWDGGLALSHAMFDEVHSFQVWYRADAGGRIVEADSITLRLPYGGICSDPQPRIRSLVGEHLDAGLRKRLGGLVGGTTGCAQLYDLTADLLKLLSLS